MDVHKNARSVPASRALLFKRVSELGFSVRAASEAAGMSERRSREWIRRAERDEPLTDRGVGTGSLRTNGKVERVIQTLLREWAYRFEYNSSAERRRWLTPYMHFYNYHRAHSALSDNPPISRLDRNNVLRRNS